MFLSQIKFTDRIAQYNAFDEVCVKPNLLAMENLFAGLTDLFLNKELTISFEIVRNDSGQMQW